jgi:hypothetical protein
VINPASGIIKLKAYLANVDVFGPESWQWYYHHVVWFLGGAFNVKATGL